MVFLLTALKVYYVLDLELSSLPDPTPNESEELKRKRKKGEEDELICRHAGAGFPSCNIALVPFHLLLPRNRSVRNRFQFSFG